MNGQPQKVTDERRNRKEERGERTEKGRGGEGEDVRHTGLKTGVKAETQALIPEGIVRSAEGKRMNAERYAMRDS